MPRRHGTRSRYTGGCRCPACRAANRTYQRRYQRERRRPDPPGPRLVPAAATRRRLHQLAELGVPLTHLADLTGIPASTLADVVTGRTTRTRPHVEAAVLARYRELIGRHTGGTRRSP
jgi:hypothetical protein